jgi:hypothetical protein
MKAKNQAVPDEVLSKEFLSRCKQFPGATTCPGIGENA